MSVERIEKETEDKQLKVFLFFDPQKFLFFFDCYVLDLLSKVNLPIRLISRMATIVIITFL